MERVKDGGSAFPHEAYGMGQASNGMTLRQWYAGMAMQGILCSPGWCHAEFINKPELYAQDACAIADAILKELEK